MADCIQIAGAPTPSPSCCMVDDGLDPWFLGIVWLLLSVLIGYPVWRGVQLYKERACYLLQRYVVQPCCGCAPKRTERNLAKVLVGRARVMHTKPALERPHVGAEQKSGAGGSDFMRKRKERLDALDEARGLKRRRGAAESALAPPASLGIRRSKFQIRESVLGHGTKDFMRTHDARRPQEDRPKDPSRGHGAFRPFDPGVIHKRVVSMPPRNRIGHDR